MRDAESMKVLEKYRDVELRPWQKECLDAFRSQNDKEILLVVVEHEGGAGKGVLMKHMEVNGIAKAIPAIAESMMGFCCVHPSEGYVIRLARSTDRSSKSLWRAIEQIKTGELRYRKEERRIKPPKIIVLSAIHPPEGMLSEDKWKTLDYGGWECKEYTLSDGTRHVV